MHLTVQPCFARVTKTHATLGQALCWLFLLKCSACSGFLAQDHCQVHPPTAGHHNETAAHAEDSRGRFDKQLGETEAKRVFSQTPRRTKSPRIGLPQ